MTQPCIDDVVIKFNPSNIGPMLVDNSEGKPLPKRFKYIDQNLIRQNLRKQFRSKHLLLSCACQYRYIHVEKANGGVVEEACNDECLNRQIYIECVNCEWGNYCTNRNFTKGCQYTLLLFSADAKGWGVKTLDLITKGSFVIEYNGEIITQEEFQDRSNRYENSSTTHFYAMALANNFVIDATNKGNISRFINHSCDPNLMTQLWSVDGYHRMGFFAIKDIQPGTELSFDYNFIRFNSKPQKCFCNAKNCTGEIGRSIMSLGKVESFVPQPTYLDESIVVPSKCQRISIKSTVKPAKARAKGKSQVSIDDSQIDTNLAVNDQSPLKSSDVTTLSSPCIISDMSTSVETPVKKKPDPLLNNIKQYIEDVDMNNDTCIQKFLHFVIRSKTAEHKVLLLECLLGCHTDKCLLEFLRYKLLVLLWSWTTEDEAFDSSRNQLQLLEYREKFLDVLQLFNIPYRNPIDESKLENRLNEWKSEMANPGDESLFQMSHHKCDIIVDKIDKIFNKWSGLEKKFKIPKKSTSSDNNAPQADDRSVSIDSTRRLSYDPSAKHRKETNMLSSVYNHFKRFKPNVFNHNHMERKYDSFDAKKPGDTNSDSDNRFGQDNFSHRRDFATDPRKGSPASSVEFNQYQNTVFNQKNEADSKAVVDDSSKIVNTSDNPPVTDPRLLYLKRKMDIKPPPSNTPNNHLNNIYTGQPDNSTTIKGSFSNIGRTEGTSLKKNEGVSLNKNPPEKIDPIERTKRLDQIFLEKFNRRYIIPNWDSNDPNNKKFKDELAVYLVNLLKPYYSEGNFDNPYIKIHSKIEFKYLAKKMTHLIIMKELRFIERSTGKSIIQLSQLPHTKPIIQFDEKIKERIKVFFKEFISSYSK